ncbi:MAG: TonB-dependent receptor [Bradymonadaceae bacterium]|nr:TonB-dependent receptor [Lujinxingiaceae bacterium]
MSYLKSSHPSIWALTFILLWSVPAGAVTPEESDDNELEHVGEALGENQGDEEFDEDDDFDDEELDDEELDDEELDEEASDTSFSVVEMVTTTARAPIEAFISDRSVAVATGDDILVRGAINVAEAVNEEPGLSQQTTNRGANTISIRGLIGPENLIYVDGVRYNQSTGRTGPNQSLNTLDPWAIRRIEIVRGPGSVLYGSGAMGGVIHVFPHEVPDEQLALRGLGVFRSVDNAIGTGLDIGGQTGSVGLATGFSVRDYGQLNVGQRVGAQGIFASAEDREEGVMLASDYSEMFWRAGARADITRYSSFRLNYMGGQLNGAPRTDALGRGDMRLNDNRDDLMWATYAYDRGRGPLTQLTLNASFHRTRERVDAYRCQTSARPDGSAGRVLDLAGCAARASRVVVARRIDDDVVNTVGTSLTGVSHVPGVPLRLSWGGEHYRDRVLSVRDVADGPDVDFVRAPLANFVSGSAYASTGVFVHGEFSLFADAAQEVVLNGGGRVENFRASAPDDGRGLGEVDFSNTGLVGALGISYLYATNLNLYLNWSQGFRAPNLQEATFLGDSGNFFEVPNPDLAPERNDTFELGTKIDWPRVAQLTGAVYVSLLSDRIVREAASFEGEPEFNAKPVQRRVNAESAYYYGSELGVQTAPLLGTRLFANVAYIDGGVETNAPDDRFAPGPLHELVATGDAYENPRRLTPVEYMAGLTFSLDPSWWASFYVQGAGAQDKLGRGDLQDLRICEAEVGVLYSELNQSCPGTPGWTTFNVRGGYFFDDYGRIDLSFHNLTDLRYRHHGSGILAPGFGAMVTLTATHH